ncbi:choline monooxygenase, chloroplastic isoform X4 [Durio zibethinus]|uniref:Choline monooxygenase, chloroplastic n=1 Tax=Durio zibethinus TaxID=66656 RepID=A0A6P5ZKY9_DURZI|nr:choline monooxygenase, chloroplastic isoform X4 [Durio zibethinus]
MSLLLKPISRVFLFQSNFQNPRAIPNFSSVSASCSSSYEAQKMVRQFDPKIPIEQAITPPSSWYADPSFYAFELDRVFYRGWQAVGHTQQIKEPNDFFSGRLGNVEFLVCRDDDGKIAAFHNVCRHHASLLVSGSGKKSCFTCPYHGWTYGLNGALRKATRISGIQDFIANEFGLIPIKVAIWGPFVLLNMDKEILPEDNIDTDQIASEWLGSCSEILRLNGVDSPLTYVCRREYIIECNWKIFEKVSIQSVEGGSKETQDDRLGSKALYAFIYPNFMINRYGPWMDTNLLIPLGPRKCLVVFDYFLEASLKEDKAFIERSLVDSERIQMEDITLCEGVQRGIESPAYCTGRYAPRVEMAMHHFHCLLYDNLIS